MRTVKDVKKIDNYLTATTGELNGRPIYLNVAYVTNGKIKRFKRYFDLHFPPELHEKKHKYLRN